MLCFFLPDLKNDTIEYHTTREIICFNNHHHIGALVKKKKAQWNLNRSPVKFLPSKGILENIILNVLDKNSD